LNEKKKLMERKNGLNLKKKWIEFEKIELRKLRKKMKENFFFFFLLTPCGVVEHTYHIWPRSKRKEGAEKSWTSSMTFRQKKNERKTLNFHTVSLNTHSIK